MNQAYFMIITTTGSREEAEHLAKILVENSLAACVQISAITSIYTWQDALHKDAEHLLLIKTRSALYQDVEEAICRHHSYETPEIIAVPILAGSAAYLAWIAANTVD